MGTRDCTHKKKRKCTTAPCRGSNKKKQQRHMLHLSEHDLLQTHFYHGNISFEETIERLQRQMVGTYLIRSSRSDPQSLVIGFKTASEVVEQCIMAPCPSGYLIGTTVFPSIDAVLAANRHILRHAPHLALPEPALHAHVDGPTFAPPDEVREIIVRESRGSTGTSENSTEKPRCCPVCFEDAACCVLVPCGHVFCKPCCAKLVLCALCRRRKESFIVAWL